MRVALFTDTLGDVNGVARFVAALAEHAHGTGNELLVITSTRRTVPHLANVINVPARAAMRLPRYPELEVVWPRRGEMWRRVQAFAPDVVHVSTPGPVGLAGRGFARRLGAALVGTYHTDFPAYVERLTGVRVLGSGAAGAMRWFYRPFDRVLARSQAYAQRVAEVGIERGRVGVLRPGIDLAKFSPSLRTRDEDDVVRFISVGRISAEKGTGFLARVWRGAQSRLDAAGVRAELVVVGDGPARGAFERDVASLRVRFMGYRFGEELARAYADADAFVFPSVTDTLGQVVMEAQASGVAALVSDRGGPRELVRNGETGLVLPGNDEPAWVAALVALATDTPRRRAMGAAAALHMAEFAFEWSFESFWSQNAEAMEARLTSLARASGWSITSRPSGAVRAAP